MSPQVFIALLLLTLVCAVFAQMLATRRGRSPRLWMWLVVLFGPVPLAVLALLPDRRGRAA